MRYSHVYALYASISSWTLEEKSLPVISRITSITLHEPYSLHPKEPLVMLQRRIADRQPAPYRLLALEVCTKQVKERSNSPNVQLLAGYRDQTLHCTLARGQWGLKVTDGERAVILPRISM